MTNGFTGPIPNELHARDFNFSRNDLIAMVGPPNPADFELGSMSKWMPESMTKALFAHLKILLLGQMNTPTLQGGSRDLYYANRIYAGENPFDGNESEADLYHFHFVVPFKANPNRNAFFQGDGDRLALLDKIVVEVRKIDDIINNARQPWILEDDTKIEATIWNFAEFSDNHWYAVRMWLEKLIGALNSAGYSPGLLYHTREFISKRKVPTYSPVRNVFLPLTQNVYKSNDPAYRSLGLNLPHFIRNSPDESRGKFGYAAGYFKDIEDYYDKQKGRWDFSACPPSEQVLATRYVPLFYYDRKIHAYFLVDKYGHVHISPHARWDKWWAIYERRLRQSISSDMSAR